MKLVDAWAIVGPDGNCKHIAFVSDEDWAWLDYIRVYALWNKASTNEQGMPRIDGYRCERVLVSPVNAAPQEQKAKASDGDSPADAAPPDYGRHNNCPSESGECYFGAEGDCPKIVAEDAALNAAPSTWNAHGNFGMRYPEQSDLSGGATDAAPRSREKLADALEDEMRWIAGLTDSHHIRQASAEFIINNGERVLAALRAHPAEALLQDLRQRFNSIYEASKSNGTNFYNGQKERFEFNELAYKAKCGMEAIDANLKESE